MSSPDRCLTLKTASVPRQAYAAARALLSGAASFLLIMALAACSFAPVFGDPAANARRYQLVFDEPASRLEQIVYQELQKTFEISSATNALLVRVKTADASIAAGATSISLDASMTLLRRDPTGVGAPEAIYQTTRTATATLSDAEQRLAADAAENEAAERAAETLAQTLRLTLLSVLATLDEQGILAQPYGSAVPAAAQ